MINSVSQVHMVRLATIHYLHHGCLRNEHFIITFSSFQLPDVLPHSRGFCTVQAQNFPVLLGLGDLVSRLCLLPLTHRLPP